MDLKQHIGIRVRAARTRRGLTQEGVAEQIGKAAETVSNIERGQTLTGLDTLERLSRCLQIPVSEFFEGYVLGHSDARDTHEQNGDEEREKKTGRGHNPAHPPFKIAVP